MKIKEGLNRIPTQLFEDNMKGYQDLVRTIEEALQKWKLEPFHLIFWYFLIKIIQGIDSDFSNKKFYYSEDDI